MRKINLLPQRFYTHYEEKLINLRPLLSIIFLRDFQNPKKMDIGLWEVGTKRPVNGMRKCDGQTNKQTLMRTFRLIGRINSEGQFFENIYA